MDNQIEIEALIEVYMPNAMTDQYESGPPVTFDATVIKVTSPASLSGKSISILHDHPQPEGSLWRQQGVTISLHIETDLLKDSQLLFSGAVSDIKRIETP